MPMASRGVSGVGRRGSAVGDEHGAAAVGGELVLGERDGFLLGSGDAGCVLALGVGDLPRIVEEGQGDVSSVLHRSFGSGAVCGALVPGGGALERSKPGVLRRAGARNRFHGARSGTLRIR